MFAGALFGLLAWLRPRPRPPAQADLVEGVQRLLTRSKGAALSEPLAAILAARATWRTETQNDPLLGQPAPDFTLPDHRRRPVALRDLLAKGPVVVVFYYGYYCDHCVAQLYGLQEDRKYFDELGATVVAISADTPEETAAKFREYAAKGGEFGFPTLSDAGNRVAERYGTMLPQRDGRPESQLHGTFVLDAKGTVRWANVGPAPFVNNRGLLCEVAAVAGRLPAK